MKIWETQYFFVKSQPFPKRQILDSSKLKEQMTISNLMKITESPSKWVENTENQGLYGKGFLKSEAPSAC